MLVCYLCGRGVGSGGVGWGAGWGAGWGKEEKKIMQRGSGKSYLGVSALVLSARKRAFSAPRICTVDAGCFASDISDPCAAIRTPINVQRLDPKYRPSVSIARAAKATLCAAAARHTGLQRGGVASGRVVRDTPEFSSPGRMIAVCEKVSGMRAVAVALPHERSSERRRARRRGP